MTAALALCLLVALALAAVLAGRCARLTRERNAYRREAGELRAAVTDAARDWRAIVTTGQGSITVEGRASTGTAPQSRVLDGGGR